MATMNAFGIDLSKLNGMTDDQIRKYAEEISIREIEKSNAQRMKNKKFEKEFKQTIDVDVKKERNIRNEEPPKKSQPTPGPAKMGTHKHYSRSPGQDPMESISRLMEVHLTKSTLGMPEFENKLHHTGFEIQMTVSDGDCMFHAISLQLDRVANLKKSRYDVRREVAEFMREKKSLSNGTDLTKFVIGDWGKYINGMAQKDWGDHVVLAIVSQLYFVGIMVYTTMSDEPIYVSSHKIENRPILTIGHYSEVHYVSVVPRQPKGLPQPDVGPSDPKYKTDGDYYDSSSQGSGEFVKSGNSPLPATIGDFPGSTPIQKKPKSPSTSPLATPPRQPYMEPVLRNNSKIDKRLVPCRVYLQNFKESNGIEYLQNHDGTLINNNDKVLNKFLKGKNYHMEPKNNTERSAKIGQGRISKVYHIKTVDGFQLCLKRIRMRALKSMKDDICRSLLLQINLNHTNILKFKGIFGEQWFENGDSLNIYTEYANCGSLYDFIKSSSIKRDDKVRSGLILKTAYTIFKQLLDGLAYLENFNIVHRNFSDHNILINTPGRNRYTAMISGFGFARVIDKKYENGYLNSCHHKLEGSARYIAPERYRNEPYNESSDVWCLAVMFYRMLFGCHPPVFYVKDDPLAYKIAHEGIGMDELLGEKMMIQTGIPENLKEIAKSEGGNLFEEMIVDMTLWAPEVLDIAEQTNSDSSSTGNVNVNVDDVKGKCYKNRPTATRILEKYSVILSKEFIELIPETVRLSHDTDHSQSSTSHDSGSSSSITKQLHLEAYERGGRNEKQGVAVIINNIKFDKYKDENGKLTDKWNRDGSNQDKYMLVNFFERNKYIIKQKDNLTGKEMKAFLKDVADEIMKFDIKCYTFVCCILTHGSCMEVFGTDWDRVGIAEITNTFSSKNCHKLRKRPKVFIIQACQNIPKHFNVGLTNAIDPKIIPEQDDYLLALSTIFGTSAFRDQEDGSYFIMELCRYLEMADEDFARVCYRTNAKLCKLMCEFRDCKIDKADLQEFCQTPGLFSTVIREVHLRAPSGNK